MKGWHSLFFLLVLLWRWCGRGESNPQGLTPDGFSYQLRLSPPPCGVCGLDYPFTLANALGAARLVSTPSLAGLVRDCHVKGFPEFEQFCILGFPQEHSRIWPKSVASTNSATPAKPFSAIVSELLIAKGKGSICWVFFVLLGLGALFLGWLWLPHVDCRCVQRVFDV